MRASDTHKLLLAVAALVEPATGLALLIDPGFVAWWLFGSTLSVGAVAVGRVTGLSLACLGIACWPSLDSA
jgi:hypothetical protein